MKIQSIGKQQSFGFNSVKYNTVHTKTAEILKPIAKKIKKMGNSDVVLKITTPGEYPVEGVVIDKANLIFITKNGTKPEVLIESAMRPKTAQEWLEFIKKGWANYEKFIK